MSSTMTMEQYARTLVRRMAARLDARRGDPRRRISNVSISAIEWMLPQFVRLAEELHDEPIGRLQPVVRRMLMEQIFCDDSGDAVMTPAQRRHIDRQVQWILRILALARQQTRQSAYWSTMPVTPQMFG